MEQQMLVSCWETCTQAVFRQTKKIQHEESSTSLLNIPSILIRLDETFDPNIPT